MFKTNFIYSYDTEGFCPACFNYWRYCDCIGNLFEDVGHPDDDKENDDDDDDSTMSDINTVAANVVTPSPPGKRPMDPPGDSPGFPKRTRPLLNRPLFHDSISDLFPDSARLPSDYMDIPDNSATSSIDVPPIVDMDWVTGMLGSIATPALLTPQEMNDRVVAGDVSVPAGATFTTPSLEDLGRIPYSQSTVPVAVLLQSDANVPMFGGVGYTDGNPTQEYKQWYFEEFLPWYGSNATPQQKMFLSAVECLSPPSSSGNRSFAGLPDIYLQKREGPDGTKYSWEYKGKVYHKNDLPPSPREMWFPDEFSTVIQPRSGFKGRQSRNTVRNVPLRVSDYHFPDSIETDVFSLASLPVIVPVVPPPPPPPVFDITPTNADIEKGAGTAESLMRPTGLTNPNLWKYCTYNYNTLNGLTDYNVLQTDPSPVPFFGNTRMKCSRINAGSAISLFAYNHMRNGTKPIHGLCKFTLTFVPRAGETANRIAEIRIFASTATGIRMTTNIKDSLADLVFAPSTNWNEFSVSATVPTTVTFGAYIPPTSNASYSGVNPYIQIDVRLKTGSGMDFYWDEVACFRNKLTITPSFEPDILQETTIEYNNLGTILQCDQDGLSNRCTQLGAFSDPNGVNTIGFFSKCWIKTLDQPLLIKQPGRVDVSWPKVNGLSGVWSVIPMIGPNNQFSFVPLAVNVDVVTPILGSLTLMYRVQHLNISNIWLN